MDRNDSFIKAARVKFAELRAEYQTIMVCSNAQFSNLCANTLALAEPTPFDFLAVAAVLVREAEEVSNRLDVLAADTENQRLCEGFVSASTERDWT